MAEKTEKSTKFEKFTIEKATIDLEKVDFDKIDRSKTNIIFDTNFLFVTFQFNVDVIAELRNLFGSKFKLFIYAGTILELENLEKKKTKNKRFIPLIIKMLHLYNFKIINSNQTYIDDQIEENLDKDFLIATNDKELRIKIQLKRFKVIYLRQKSYLEVK